ncbi:MAG: hypothetical protein AAGC81_03135 [Pseudomonadota bacterium]
MSLTPAYLEDFVAPHHKPKEAIGSEEPESVETLLARARGKARAEGVAEGVASAEAQEAAEQTTLLNAIREAFDDAALTAASQETALRSRLVETIVALLRALAPELVQSRTQTALTTALADLQETAPQDLVRIYVPKGLSSQTASLTAPLERKMEIVEDPNLHFGQSRISWQTGFDQIDNAAIVDAAISALTAEFERSAPSFSQLASETSL